jgi:1-acyl-sn-glycerol-3-phosphate acyltransferase
MVPLPKTRPGRIEATAAEQYIKRPTYLSRLVKGFLLALYRWKGWAITSAGAVPKHCVIVGAPHTTNWDFVFFIGVTHQLGIKPSFMGKLALFRRPLTRFMYDMGGIPIDRRARDKNYVDQMVAAFAKAPELALVVAPEGTRGPITAWRSGFYHIALGAGVPIVPAWVDHATMKGGLGAPIALSGDYDADLKTIARFYHAVMPRHPKLAVLYAEAGIPGETDDA